MRKGLVWLVLLILAFGYGCAASGGGAAPFTGGGGGGGGGTGAADGPPYPFVAGPRSSAPLAFSADGQLLGAVSPETNQVSFFQVAGPPNPDTIVRLSQVSVGSEPQSLAMAGNTRAYTANAVGGTVSFIDTTPVAGGGLASVIDTITVGTEPSALVLTPNGTRLFVANAGSNTVSVIDTASNTVMATVDLSALGGSQPRALSVTNDGDADDLDEQVFVALFFATNRPGRTGLDEAQEDQREGHVGVISTADNSLGAAPVVLAPMANTGFNSNGSVLPFTGTSNGAGGVAGPVPTNPQTFTNPTGAWPNQLAAVGLHPTSGLAYVVSTAASPNGPFRFNSNVQGLVSVFNTGTLLEVTAAQTDPTVRRTAPLNMNQGVQLSTTPAPRFFLSNPTAIAWRPDGTEAWVAIQTTNLLVRLNVDGTGVPSVGAPLVAGPSVITRVDLENPGGGLIAGKAPRGVIFNAAGDRLYTFNHISRSISVVNPDTRTVVATAQSASVPATQAQRGAELFHTGRGPNDRMSNEAWGACIACHPGGLADGVTWMFPAGPRQTIPLDGMFNPRDTSDQRILNFSALRDENQDFELNTRNVFGGRGLIENDRLIFIAGGTTGGTPTDTNLIQQFQQFTGVVGTTNGLTNQPLPTLLDARRDFGMATLPDGRIIIAGGRSGAADGALITGANTVLQFDPATNAVTALNNTGFTPRHSLGMAAVITNQGPRVYAVGGYDAAAAATAAVTIVEEYDPGTDSWRPVASLPGARAEFGTAVAGGINTAEPRQLLHVVLGNEGSRATPDITLASNVLRFQPDPAGTGAWTAANIVGLTPRKNLGAGVALRGASSRIFAIGGEAAGVPLDTVEEYTAQALTLVATAHTALPATRRNFAIASTGSTNQIYVIGGEQASFVDQTTIFEYTPANQGPVAGPAGTPSGTWVTRANLPSGLRRLQASSPPPVANFHPVANTGRSTDQDAIAEWIRLQVRSARAPLPATDPSVQSGRALFATDGVSGVPGVSCASCHGGGKWTRSTVDFTPPPSAEIGLGFGSERVIGVELRQTATQGANVLINVGTFNAAANNEIRFNPADISNRIAALGGNGYQPPSLLSVYATAPYFHGGSATTLEEVLNGSRDGFGGSRVHFVSSASQRADLINFLRSIDESTTIFP